MGRVLGVAVLAAVCANQDDYETRTAFVAGFTPALTIGAITVAIGRRGGGADPAAAEAAASLRPAVDAP